MAKQWKLYMHTNKINGKKYIGITSREDVEVRWGKDGERYENQVFGKAIQKYGWDGFKHEVLATGTEIEIKRLEKEYIEKFNTKSPFGYNVVDGGKANVSTRAIKVYQYDMNYNLIKEWNSIDDIRVFYKVSDVSIKKYCDRGFGIFKDSIFSYTKVLPNYDISVKEIDDKNKRMIFQYNKDMELVKIWKNTTECMEYGLNRKKIYLCCRGDVSEYNDCIWSRTPIKEKELIEKIYKKTSNLPIYQYNMNGELVKKWKNVKECEENGFSKDSILSNCKSMSGTYKNFKWSNHILSEDEIKTNLPKKDYHRKILQYNKNENTLLREWNNAKECAKDGFNERSIVDCCRGNSKSHGGYSWKFA